MTLTRSVSWPVARPVTVPTGGDLAMAGSVARHGAGAHEADHLVVVPPPVAEAGRGRHRRDDE